MMGDEFDLKSNGRKVDLQEIKPIQPSFHVRLL